MPPLVRLANEWGVVNRPALFGLSLVASVLVTIGGSAITYRWIEIPAIDLGHRLSQRIQFHFKRQAAG